MWKKASGKLFYMRKIVLVGKYFVAETLKSNAENTNED